MKGIETYDYAETSLFGFSPEDAPMNEGIETTTFRSGFGLDAAHCLVGLETANNLVMDFLESRPYTTYVIPPNQVASSRGRFSSSGRRNDRSDAHLLADMLRTDRARFAPWQANGVTVNQMKAALRLIDDLTQSITRYSNRLRAALLRLTRWRWTSLVT